MRESRIESVLKKHTEENGGMCLKLTPFGFAGIPDRLVLLPGGVMFFAELKAPGGKVSKLQAFMHRKLRALGFLVKVPASVTEAKEAVYAEL